MTEAPAKRRRPHVAAGARVVVAGAATAGTLAMVGLMAGPVEEPPVELEAPPTAAAATVAVADPPATRIVVVRRHHPAPAGSVASVAPANRPTPAAAAVARPAPAPRPSAPAPAPTTTSDGS